MLLMVIWPGLEISNLPNLIGTGGTLAALLLIIASFLVGLVPSVRVPSGT
jgi:hypothetical protein